MRCSLLLLGFSIACANPLASSERVTRIELDAYAWQSDGRVWQDGTSLAFGPADAIWTGVSRYLAGRIEIDLQLVGANGCLALPFLLTGQGRWHANTPIIGPVAGSVIYRLQASEWHGTGDFELAMRSAEAVGFGLASGCEGGKLMRYEVRW